MQMSASGSLTSKFGNQKNVLDSSTPVRFELAYKALENASFNYHTVTAVIGGVSISNLTFAVSDINQVITFVHQPKTPQLVIVAIN